MTIYRIPQSTTLCHLEDRFEGFDSSPENSNRPSNDLALNAVR